MKRIVLFAGTGLLLLTAACMPRHPSERIYVASDPGTISDGTYSNGFFNFSFQVPEHWHSLSPWQIRDITQPEGNSTCIAFILNTRQQPTASFSIVTEPLSEEEKTVITNSAVFNLYAAKKMKERSPELVIRKGPPVQLGGVSFDTLLVKLANHNTQRHYAALRNGAVLVFCATHSTEEEKEELNGLLRTIRFD
jgi:hypothetical protein